MSVTKRNTANTAAKSPSLNSVQRQTMRATLATGATVAVLIGAQTLAVLDRGDNSLSLGAAAPVATDQVSPTPEFSATPLSDAQTVSFGADNTVLVGSDGSLTSTVTPQPTAIPSNTVPSTTKAVATKKQATQVPPTATLKPTLRPTAIPTLKPKATVIQPTPRTRSSRH